MTAKKDSHGPSYSRGLRPKQASPTKTPPPIKGRGCLPAVPPVTPRVWGWDARPDWPLPTAEAGGFLG